MRGLPYIKTSEEFHLYQLILLRDCLEGGILAPHLLSGLRVLNPQWVQSVFTVEAYISHHWRPDA